MHDPAAEPQPPLFQPAGDCAVLVTLGQKIDPGINQQVHALARRLRSSEQAGLGEAVPGYASLLVHYDPLRLRYQQAADMIRRALAGTETQAEAPRRVEIPVYYGGAGGPDLAHVAAVHQISQAAVVAIHSGRDYPVYMMGFMPGFPYLGGMDPAIATPRLATPRSRIPAGSVGIAGEQTGVYPMESPGGWQIIGRTPLRLFDLERYPPFLLSPGDLVRFIPLAINQEA